MVTEVASLITSGIRRVPLLRTARGAITNNRRTNNGCFAVPRFTASFPVNNLCTTPAWVTSTIFNSAKLITPEQIPIASELVEGHWLHQHITKSDPISTSAELDEILETIERTVDLTVYESGAIPASPNAASEYSNSSWRRDNAIMTVGMTLAALLEPEGSEDREELVQKVKDELIAMASYDNDPFQRGHFTSFLFLNPDPNENKRLAKEKFESDINGLPRAKQSIIDGKLGEYKDWGHHQLDSLGAYLYAFFFAANQGIIDLKELDSILTGQNSENGHDSLFSVALHFLHEIGYEDVTDIGPWEYKTGKKRASSVSLCLAAFKEAKQYFESKGWNPNETITVNPNVNLKQIIDDAIEKGDAIKNERIPLDGSPAVETNEIPCDSALAFSLLFDPGLNEAQQDAIVQRLIENMGEYGIRRMPDELDAFFGENFASNPNGQGKWSVIYPGHKAAQWTLFDPILAAHFYGRYLKSGGKDEKSFLLADRFMKRSLSQLTKHDYEIEFFVNPLEKRTVKIPAGVLPEARWKKEDGEREEWLPNPNSPLQMAHGVFAIMVSEATRAIQLRESITNQALAA
ncbi:MAG: hypothetical protein A3B68_05370 [Candidatus Melainabacteria bacterium RIFCSPHIGHO2_02_FULL_34_12]|nr:MAG: hypothetical protein A3B68_05370 [Candidatus Melainabacteria bacterium RIFCSPHIGHO2_02_FULL_34_12]